MDTNPTILTILKLAAITLPGEYPDRTIAPLTDVRWGRVRNSFHRGPDEEPTEYGPSDADGRRALDACRCGHCECGGHTLVILSDGQDPIPAAEYLPASLLAAVCP